MDTNLWFEHFLKNHGERLIFSFMALSLGGIFYWVIPDMQGEAKTILIGIAMLWFNKARGGNGGQQTSETAQGVKKAEK